MGPLLLVLLLAGQEPSTDKIGESDINACRTDALGSMVKFQDEYRRYVTEDVADLRFVPSGSQRAMTYVDPRSKRLTTMVTVGAMMRMCPDTILLMARHEACHVRLDADRLREERPIEMEERMRIETRASMCAMPSELDR